MADLDRQVMDLPDSVQRELQTIERELLELMEQKIAAARWYAVRYAETGETRPLGYDYDGPDVARDHAPRIVNAFRSAAGEPGNPFNPATARLGFWLFDRLRGDEFVTLQSLHAEARTLHISSGRFQIEPVLGGHLNSTRFEVEKGKVDGRVAYRIVEHDYIVSTIWGWRVECSPNGVLNVSRNGDATISVLPTGTHAALDSLGGIAKARIVEWWEKVRP